MIIFVLPPDFAAEPEDEDPDEPFMTVLPPLETEDLPDDVFVDRVTVLLTEVERDLLPVFDCRSAELFVVPVIPERPVFVTFLSVLSFPAPFETPVDVFVRVLRARFLDTLVEFMPTDVVVAVSPRRAKSRFLYR